MCQDTFRYKKDGDQTGLFSNFSKSYGKDKEFHREKWRYSNSNFLFNFKNIFCFHGFFEKLHDSHIKLS